MAYNSYPSGSGGLSPTDEQKLGGLYNSYTGNLGTYWYSNTDDLKMIFTSDGSVTRKGFKVYSYDYLITQTQSANGSIVMDARLY